jgi:hypothetical protein
MVDQADGTRRPSANKPPTREKRREARRDFATAIAKAEFGRFYWSGDQERALRAAVAKRAKPTR